MAQGLHYIATLDNTDLKKKFADQRRMILDSGKTAEAEALRVETIFKRAGIAAAGYFTAQQALSFGQDIIRVRGERQMLEQSFEVLLQSRSKANKMISEITQLAINSPLEMTPVANAAQTLLGFGLDAARVMPIIGQLSDVSMGNQQRFESLALVYAQVQSAGKLMGQDLLQMINAGFNPLTIIADQTGKSVAQLKDEMSKGAISADMVADAFKKVTSEGGKFYQMTQKQADGIIGNQATFEDAIVQMKNKIGTNYEEIIKSGYQAATAVVENYDVIGDAIMVLIATYGTYRAALIVTNAAEKLNLLVLRQAIVEKRLAAAAGITLSNSEAIAASKTKLLSVAKMGLVKSLKAVSSAMLANPYALVLAAVVGLGYGIYKFANQTDAATKAQSELSKCLDEETKKLDDNIKAITKAKRGTKERAEAINSFNSEYGKYLSKLITEKDSIEKLSVAYDDAKCAVVGFQIAKAKESFISEPLGDLTKETQKFYNQLGDFTKELSSPEQQARFSAYVDQILDDVTKGENFDISKIYNAFRAAKASKSYNNIDDWKKAVRDDNESFGASDVNIIDSIGGWDVRQVDFFGKGIQRLQGVLNSAESDFEKFSSAYSEVVNPKSTSGTDVATFTSYNEQLKDARSELALFSKELQELQNKQAPEGAGADFSFAKAIEEKTKQEKEAQDKVNTLTGIDPKAAKLAAAEYDKLQKQYQADRLASLKDAKAAESDLERDAIKNKIKLIEFERDARIVAIREEKEAYKQKHGEDADTSGFDRQETAISQKADANIQEQIQGDTKAQLVAMQEYLKEYGTFQQKKYAVAQEYARKIKEAQTEEERLSLGKELAAFNSDLNAQDLKMNIDWVTVFGEFGGMFSEMIKPALEDAKKLLGTDEFKNADEASKRALIEAVAQMEAAVGGSGSLNFKQLGVDMQAYQNSLITLNRVKQEEIESIEKLKEAQGKYEEALKSGSQTEIDTTKTNLDNAQINTDAAAENVQAQTDTTNNFKQQVNNTAASLRGGMEDITNNINKLASGSFAGAYEGIVGLMKSLGGADTALGKLAEKLDIPIISWVLGLLDALKDGLSDLIGGVLDGIFNAISGIISDVLSGDLFITIGESISKGLFSIIKSIFTLGGVFDFLDHESDPDLQADVDRLTASNERLEEALNRLADKMDDVATSEATSVYKEQLDNVKNRERNSQEMMQREAEAWARFGYGFAGLGGKGSSNSKINNNISGSEWSEISKIVGRKISNAGDFWGLSSEDMAKVADEAGWIYDKIKGYADDGHKDAAKYMDDYISYAKEREELEKAYYEKLTATSFDSVRDEFKNTLLDMGSDAEDFASNFEKIMQNAIIESMMSTKYDAKLKEWYKNFAAAMEDGDMTQGEKDALQSNYNNVVNDALKERDALKDIFGWDDESESSREASKRGIASASQESVDENNGRLTAIQGHTYIISESMKIIQPDITSIRDSMAFIRDNVVAQLTIMRGIEINTAPISELRTEMGYVKSALEAIRDKGIPIKK